MRIGNKGIDLIKSFEGCSLVAYLCPSNVWTIGWGHTGGVYEGQRITQAQADQLFIEDIKKYEPTGNWNQNQFDALTSFSYNCGVGAMQSVIDSGDITGEMALYINGSNGVLQGLVRRRKAEIELFNTPIEKPNLLKYQGHIQEIGWQETKFNDEICGTTGQSLRLEALSITYPNILFRCHIENLGWTNQRASGEMIGTIGNSLRIEAIEILSSELAFSVHIEGIGWTDYKTNAVQGTTGQARRIEAIRIKQL